MITQFQKNPNKIYKNRNDLITNQPEDNGIIPVDTLRDIYIELEHAPSISFDEMWWLMRTLNNHKPIHRIFETWSGLGGNLRVWENIVSTKVENGGIIVTRPETINWNWQQSEKKIRATSLNYPSIKNIKTVLSSEFKQQQIDLIIQNGEEGCDLHKFDPILKNSGVICVFNLNKVEPWWDKLDNSKGNISKYKESSGIGVFIKV